MKKIQTNNPQNPHYKHVAESMYKALIESLGSEINLYVAIQNHSPNGRSIPNALHMAAMMENRSKSLHRDNPSAWRKREYNPTPHTYEYGIYRHSGTWEWVEIIPARPDSGEGDDDAQEAIFGWVNKNGDEPSWGNAESYEESMQEVAI